ncbi:hypothetical protein ACLB2K_027533 [Fragaria x ananassa]
MSSSITTDTENPSAPQVETQTQDEKFDWYAHWYPLMPVCDLDKRVPHAKKVLGIDVVVWWDKNESTWKVFEDACPHRLAPLSEGRIDQWGRLQCVYHGWCFNGSGDCKFIPQAPKDGPPVHTSKKACVGAYPSTMQNGIVWFWPSSDPHFKDILAEKKPPYIPELDDPSYTCLMGNREIPYGYEVLIENLMDPAHLPYAHYGIMQTPQPKEKADREGGRPLDFYIPKLDINGAPSSPGEKVSSAQKGQKRALLVFICVPVSPGNSRLISTFLVNFGVLIKIVPRWIYHIGQNLVVDSDLFLLHLEERRIMDAGLNRKWLNTGALPPTPPREQLLDRYWSHVVYCSSCSAAHKALGVLEVVLQAVSLSLLGIVAAIKQGVLASAVARTALVAAALLWFAASKWLAHFIYKTFHFHDYNHALV